MMGPGRRLARGGRGDLTGLPVICIYGIRLSLLAPPAKVHSLYLQRERKEVKITVASRISRIDSCNRLSTRYAAPRLDKCTIASVGSVKPFGPLKRE